MDEKYFEELIESITRKKPSTSGLYKSCYLTHKYAILKQEKDSLPSLRKSQRQIAVANLKKLGFNTPSIVYRTTKKDYDFEIQERAEGKPLFYNKFYDKDLSNFQIHKLNKERFLEILSIPDEQFVQYVESMYIGHQFDLLGDMHNHNVIYSKEKGFQFIDLPDKLPCYRTLDGYLEKINDRSSFDCESFVSELFHPFNGGVPYFIQNDQPYRNLVGHRLLSAIKQSSLNFDEETMRKLKNCIHSNDPTYSDALSDESMKFTLLLCGIIKPNNEEKQFIKTINHQIAKSGKYASNYFHPSLTEFIESKAAYPHEAIHKKYLEKCVKSISIDGKPALEYFEDIDSSSIIEYSSTLLPDDKIKSITMDEFRKRNAKNKEDENASEYCDDEYSDNSDYSESTSNQTITSLNSEYTNDEDYTN